MITSIDLQDVLARTVGAPYSDLVTRPTGAKVRSSIEAALGEGPREAPVVLDFSAVRVLDCSCADEVVAKLLLRRPVGPAGPSWWFLVRGVSDVQAEEIDHVLRRQGLALVAEDPDGGLRLLGTVEPAAAAAWRLLLERGSADEAEVAEALVLPAEAARRALDALIGAGIVRRAGDRVRPLTSAA